ncbi:dUTP diphosphatase [Rhizoctonia solani]|uniref:Deoxyuridine 5'-triphosphate nucleotidohydrolase n=1 Tax=Rhizoctonia solani TaxID=456999 RepID=A0A8H8SXN2_9AGAM|nr:dUTP diphosphatase [Rhizoctonia solani]QRW22316.1 dUTP diphosphatase [Rhizoctonia solani]
MPASAITYIPFDELDDRFTNAHRFGRPRRPEVLLLRPNQKKLLLLCPLLPPSPTFADDPSKGKRLRLPAEAWQRVLLFAMQAEHDEGLRRGPTDVGKVRYLLICKSFQALATPLLYSSVRIYSLRGLELFANTLANADAKWDSIRRIPYSTPGRWVQSLSLAQLAPCSSLAVDSNLVRALPVMPFLTTIELDGRYVMSWRVAALIPRSLKVLCGIRVKEEIRFEGLKSSEDDALTALVRSLPLLEELSVEGPGLDIEEDEVFEDEGPEESRTNWDQALLPNLKQLTLLDCPYTPIYRMLTRASLPALRDLTLTTTPTIQVEAPGPEPGAAPAPTTDFSAFNHSTPTTVFLEHHGSQVHRLSLVPTQQWPPAPAPAPEDLLLQCPEIRELTLCMPLPLRLLPPESSKPRGAAPVSPLLARLALSPEPGARPPTPPPPSTSPTPSYPLSTLIIPVPTHAFLACLTSPSLQNLREVRFSSAKWLRKGMGRTAQGAGVNGEMMRWRRELKRGGIKVLDSEGKEEIEEPMVSSRSMIGISSRGSRGGEIFKQKGVTGARHVVSGPSFVSVALWVARRRALTSPSATMSTKRTEPPSPSAAPRPSKIANTDSEAAPPPAPVSHLLIKRLSEKAKLPTRGSALAAGYDLYSAEQKTIPARGKALVDTQISIAVPVGTYGRVAPRSGLASKFMIDTGAGVIDADYRGVVFVLLFNHSDQDFQVEEGDRIAQLIIEKIQTPEVMEVQDLEETLRGAGGFGSTGGHGSL